MKKTLLLWLFVTSLLITSCSSNQWAEKQTSREVAPVSGSETSDSTSGVRP